MGKSQHQRRIRLARQNATQLAANSPKSKKNKADGPSRSSKLELIDQLETDVNSARLESLNSLTATLLTCDDGTRRAILSKNVIGALIKIVKDNSAPGNTVEEDLRVQCWIEALNCLRYLAVIEAPSIVGEMHNKGLVPVYLGLLDRYLAALGIEVPLTGKRKSSETILSSDPADVERVKKGNLGLEDWLILGWCISESSPKSLAALASSPTLPILLLTLAPTSSAASQFLYSLTSDDTNDLFRRRLTSTPFAKSYMTTAHDIILTPTSGDEERELIVILTAGIYRNIMRFVAKKNEVESKEQDLIKCLGLRLEGVNLPEIIKVSTEMWKQLGLEGNTALASTPYSLASARSIASPSTSLQTMRQSEALLTRTETALEILAEICASLDGINEVEEEQELNEDAQRRELFEDSDDDVQMKNEGGGGGEMEVDQDASKDNKKAQRKKKKKRKDDTAAMDLDDNAMKTYRDEDDAKVTNNQHSEPNLSTRSLSSIPSLIALFLRLASFTDISFLPTAQSSTLISTGPVSNASPITTDLVSSIHLRSLECLNNLLIVIARSSALPKEYTSICQTTWREVGILAEKIQSITRTLQNITTGSQREEGDTKLEVLEMCTSCLWALTRAKVEGRLEFSTQEVDFVRRLVTDSPSPSVIVRAIGALTCLASRPGVSIEENEASGKLLMSVISQVTFPTKDMERLEVALQALDEIFDIYGDETREYDIVFRKNNYLDALRTTRTEFKKIIKTIDKRKFPVLRIRAEGVWTNLDAFIGYREGLSLS